MHGESTGAMRQVGGRIFGEDVEGYQQGRFDYPEALPDLLTETCGLKEGSSVFEIGPGTGLATRALLGLDFVGSLTAIEPDPRLARHLAGGLERAEGAGRLHMVNAAFADATLPHGAFDLGIAASSFHWLDQETALARVRALLKPTGHWAMWWNIYYDLTQDTPFDTLLRTVLCDLPEPPSFRDGRHYSLDSDARITELQAAGLIDVSFTTIARDITLSGQQARALFATFSSIRQLDPQEQEERLAALAAKVEAGHRDRVPHRLLTTVYIARNG